MTEEKKNVDALPDSELDKEKLIKRVNATGFKNQFLNVGRLNKSDLKEVLRLLRLEAKLIK